MAKVTATDSITGIPAVITVYSICIPQVDCPALDTGATATVIVMDSIAGIPAIITKKGNRYFKNIAMPK